VGYVPAASQGAALPIIILATGLVQLVCTIWSAALGESAVASVFAIFGGFLLSYAALLLGWDHGWWAVAPVDVIHTVATFLISWLVIVGVLTVATLRLPAGF